MEDDLYNFILNAETERKLCIGHPYVNQIEKRIHGNYLIYEELNMKKSSNPVKNIIAQRIYFDILSLAKNGMKLKAILYSYDLGDKLDLGKITGKFIFFNLNAGRKQTLLN